MQNKRKTTRPRLFRAKDRDRERDGQTDSQTRQTDEIHPVEWHITEETRETDGGRYSKRKSAGHLKQLQVEDTGGILQTCAVCSWVQERGNTQTRGISRVLITLPPHRFGRVAYSPRSAFFPAMKILWAGPKRGRGDCSLSFHRTVHTGHSQASKEPSKDIAYDNKNIERHARGRRGAIFSQYEPIFSTLFLGKSKGKRKLKGLK